AHVRHHVGGLRQRLVAGAVDRQRPVPVDTPLGRQDRVEAPGGIAGHDRVGVEEVEPCQEDVIAGSGGERHLARARQQRRLVLADGQGDGRRSAVHDHYLGGAVHDARSPAQTRQERVAAFGHAAHVPGEAGFSEDLEELAVTPQLEAVVGAAHHGDREGDGVVDVGRRLQTDDGDVPWWLGRLAGDEGEPQPQQLRETPPAGRRLRRVGTWRRIVNADWEHQGDLPPELVAAGRDAASYYRRTWAASQWAARPDREPQTYSPMPARHNSAAASHACGRHATGYGTGGRPSRA